MLEWLIRIELERQALRRRVLGKLSRRGDSHYGIALLFVGVMIIAWPATIFVVTTPVHALFMSWDFFMVGAVVLAVFLLCTVILETLSLIFF